MPSITKQDGKFRAWIRLKGWPSESKSFDTRREAKAWGDERERQLRQRRLDHPDLLIDEVVGKYLKEIAPLRKMARSHAAHDVPSFRKRLRGLTLSGLTGTGLTKWVLSNTDVSASTRNWHLCRLYGVLKQAEQHWGIEIPWKDMDRCRKKLSALGYIEPAGQRSRRVSDAEIERIKASLCREVTVRMRDIIDFCVQSSMRISEVCRIEWGDLNERDRTIVIRDRKHPTRKFGNHCVVPLLNGSFETLMRQPKRALRIFPHDPTNVSMKFRLAADKAGLSDVVLHDLRHEGISRLFELGFQIQEVAMVSGHTNWKTLLRYTHLRPESLVAREAALRAKESPGRAGANRGKRKGVAAPV